MRKEKENVTLPCILTQEEKLNYSVQLAQAWSDKKKYENELDSFKAQNKSKITTCETLIDLCSEYVNTGKEFRSVECKITYNFTKKIKEWTRLDTGEIIRTEMIPEKDLQEEIL